MPLNLLSLVTRSPKMIDDFKYSLGEPLLWNGPAVIELKGKQNLESPPLAAHRSFYL